MLMILIQELCKNNQSQSGCQPKNTVPFWKLNTFALVLVLWKLSGDIFKGESNINEHKHLDFTVNVRVTVRFLQGFWRL